MGLNKDLDQIVRNHRFLALGLPLLTAAGIALSPPCHPQKPHELPPSHLELSQLIGQTPADHSEFGHHILPPTKEELDQFAREDFYRLPFGTWLAEYKDHFHLELRTEGDFFILSKKTIAEVGSALGFSSRELRKYLTTNQHRPFIYGASHRDHKLLFDAIMDTESKGQVDPQKPCNPLGYCGLMQIGYEAFNSVIRVFTNSQPKYRSFRHQTFPQFAPEYNAFNQKSSGLISLLETTNEKILRLKSGANQAIDQCTRQIAQKVWEQGGLSYQELKKKRQFNARFNRYLNQLRDYLNTVTTLEDPRYQAKAKKLYTRIARSPYSPFLNELLGTPEQECRDYLAELSPEHIRPLLEKIWDEAKRTNHSNIEVAWVYFSFLNQTYERNRTQHSRAYGHIDKTRCLLQYYNQGPTSVNRYIARHRKLPPTEGYPDKVFSAFQTFQHFNQAFYGHEEMACNTINGSIACPRPVAFQAALTNAALTNQEPFSY